MPPSLPSRALVHGSLSFALILDDRHMWVGSAAAPTPALSSRRASNRKAKENRAS